MPKTEKKKSSKGYPRLIQGRISEAKYQELILLLGRDSRLTMSELIRRIIEKQAVTIRVKSSDMSEVLERLIDIHGQLHKIGINLNQVVKSFHGTGSSIQKFLLGKKMNQDQLQILEQIEKLNLVLSQLQLKWLSE
jgi:CO dehydrogenase/acetyl-CoA synthase epsilon subunit